MSFKALLVVDVQKDFCEGGSLAIPGADEIVPLINRLDAHGQFACTVLTKDWHPANHKSFASNNPGAKPFDLGILNGMSQVFWPDHCVQHSEGSELHADLDLLGAFTFTKGKDIEVDSYSGFVDNNGQNLTGLGGFLKEAMIKELYVVGLATDYCVKYTVLDALKQGFKVTLLKDATKAVSGFDSAVEEMEDAGATITTVQEYLRSL